MGMDGYEVAFIDLHDGIEANVIRPRLVDAIELRSGHAPDVVIRQQYYESVAYRILRRMDGRWVEYFIGGGGGC
jgi:hypothetical protein